jgi:DNA-binding CsgD family transcriptional regulator
MSAGPSHEAALLGGDIDEALTRIEVPAFIFDRDGVIRWQNARAFELVGDARRRNFTSFVAPESVHRARNEFAKQVLGGNGASACEVLLRTPDGARVAAEVQAIALEDGGEIVGVFTIAQVGAAVDGHPEQHRYTLTPRQHEVLLELSEGATTAEIAASLGLARETVRNHIRGLLRSLGVHSRLEAVVEARRRGLLG